MQGKSDSGASREQTVLFNRELVDRLMHVFIIC